MPIISVIIPVYNGAKTIKETIESVLVQTWQDFEIIVIDDGSTDSTLEVIKSIPDSRIKLFSYENTGPSASRNRGISHAAGEFIAFLDADDLWKPDKLEAQLKALQDIPEAVVAYSWTNHIDESGQFLRNGSQIVVNGNAYERLLLVNFFEHGSNPLIRKQALLEVGGFDESLRQGEDWEMWLRLAARYDFVAVPLPQIFYRVYNKSASSNVLKLESGSVQVIERAFKQAPLSLQHLKFYSLANLYKYLTYKVLEAPPEQGRGWLAARFFWHGISNDLKLLPPQRDLIKIGFKITAIALLPPALAQALLAKFGTIGDIQKVLLQFMRT